MFGIKLQLADRDPRFQSTPFVPVPFCSLKTREVYLLAGFGKIYKRAPGVLHPITL